MCTIAPLITPFVFAAIADNIAGFLMQLLGWAYWPR